MGQYFVNGEIDFRGNEKEQKMFAKLLILMDKEDILEEEYLENFPFEFEEIIENALLGKLEDRGEDSGYNCRYFPDFDLTLAPKLFAALFPNAAFNYKVEWEYSVGGGQTVLWADYEDGKLFIKECQTEDDYEELDEETQEEYDEGEIDTCEIIEIIMEKKEAVEVKPERNSEYEKSFCDVENLLDYIMQGDK